MGRDNATHTPVTRSSNRRILHVDDDPVTREAVRGILSAEHEVISARGLTDALDLAKAGKFVLYLLGGMFRDGSSLELCYELRVLDPKVPVLFHSFLPNDLRQRLVLAGAAEIVDKSASAAALGDAVRRHVDPASQSQRRRTASTAR
jgi:DNA-binding response OmpR family regulator